MRRLLQQILIISAITFVLGEIVARFVLGLHPLTIDTSVWEAHPTRGWAHRPGSSERFVRLGFATDIAINARGLRERDIPYARTRGVWRILVIGDSVVAGFEVAEEEVFTRVAERALLAEGTEVEILNGGCRGYGTGQVLLFLRDEGMRYQPDVVMYRFSPNDTHDISVVHKPFRRYGKSWFDLDETGAPVLRGVPVPEFPYTQSLRVGEDGEVREEPVPLGLRARLHLRDAVAGRSALAAGLLQAAATAAPALTRPLRSAGSTAPLLERERGFDPEARGFRLFRALVIELQRTAEAGGARFVLFGPSNPWTVAVIAELGLPELGNWSGFLERIPEGVRVTAPYDPHLNATGHEIYGRMLAELLLEHGIVPAPGTQPARP